MSEISGLPEETGTTAPDGGDGGGTAVSVYSSMQYTIGTALQRACDAEHLVEVLVGNQWVTGLVVAMDGVGVVLDNHGLEHCVVRMETIAAVRVAAEAPMLEPDPVDRAGAATRATAWAGDAAMPMPGPQRTAV